MLLLLFLALIISPTAIIVIDSSADVSMFYNFTEEKEEKVNEKNIEIESLLDEVNGKEIVFTVKTCLLYTSPSPRD